MHNQIDLNAVVSTHLVELAEHIGARPAGSPGNQQAGAYIREQFTRFGWQVHTPAFDCLTWESGGIRLSCKGQPFTAHINPYSPPVDGEFPFAVCRDTAALEACGSLRGQILVLADELSQEMYMPRRFPFATFEAQQHVLNLLDAAQPAAVIGIRRGPLFCDADFHIPSATLDPAEVERLMGCQGQLLWLSIDSRTISSTGFNVIARAVQPPASRIVVCAHYDTWFGTPGALDNAAGVSALLALGQLLDAQSSAAEFVAFCGEDHYAAPGEVSYLAAGVDHIGFVINIDGVGAVGHQVGVSYVGDAPSLFGRMRAIQRESPSLAETDPWYQGDHSIFVQRGIPAVALTSTPFDDFLSYTHTPADTIQIVDAARVCDAVAFVHRLLA